MENKALQSSKISMLIFNQINLVQKRDFCFQNWKITGCNFFSQPEQLQLPIHKNIKDISVKIKTIFSGSG